LCFGSQTLCGVGIISGHRDNAVFETDGGGGDDDDDDVYLSSV